MNIHLAINGIHQEPRPEEQLRTQIISGDIPSDALCWKEGWPEWRTIAAAYPDDIPSAAVSLPAIQSTRSATTADVETFRYAYLKHEASIKSIGSLYLLGSIVLTVSGIAGLVASFTTDPLPGEEGVSLFTGVCLVAVGLFQFQVGRWLSKVNPKARTPATIFSCIGLLGFPIGTAINGYFLYLLRSDKGEMVFSEEYAEVIAATPHIKYKTSILVWILVGLLIVGLLAALIAPAISQL